MSTTSPSGLLLSGVRLGYPDGDRRLSVLDGLELAVAPGELLAVTGPSGSGKSSLLAVAGTLTRPEAGSVEVAGRDAGALDARGLARLRREQLGFVFQQSNLLGSLSAIDQLLLATHIGGKLRGRRARTQARERAAGLLARVGLAGKEGRRPHQLSGGERQRIGVARALMPGPSVLLVDEPTSALDRERGREIVGLLREITHEYRVATLMVTHDLAQLDLTDRTLALRDGCLHG
jgi:putative ABC transport system ATP-binding protein